MKKFLAVLMVLALSASLLAGAMAGEQVLDEKNLNGDNLEGHIGLELMMDVNSTPTTATEYEAAPVWNIVISTDKLIWKVTKFTTTETTKVKTVTWDPESRTYSDGTARDKDTTDKSNVSYSVDTTSKNVKLTNRSNFNVKYTAQGTQQFSIDNDTGEMTLSNNVATITITPIATMINDKIIYNETEEKDQLTAYYKTSSRSVTLEEGTATQICTADLVFTRSSDKLYPAGTNEVTEIEATTGN